MDDSVSKPCIHNDNIQKIQSRTEAPFYSANCKMI